MSHDNPDHDSVVIKLNQLAYLLNVTDDALLQAEGPGPTVARMFVRDTKAVLAELRKLVVR